MRVPLLNASLTDCVFEVARPTTVEEVNGLLKRAAAGPLAGILGYEERPLVSVDYKDDPRSAIVDALSTMVVDGTQVKILAWYDNEWGYANRMVELARNVAAGRALGGRGCPMSGAARRASPATCATTRSSPAAYWADTITDGAIRMLVLFYFYQLGLHAVPARLAVPLLRVLRDRHEPRRRLARRAARPQVDAGHGPGRAGRRARPARPRARRRGSSSPYVMAAQALSGIAKDLTKMSSKSAVKLVVADDAPGALFRWVAILTGSKNALKGVGFFLGGLLLTSSGFRARAAAARGAGRSPRSS